MGKFMLEIDTGNAAFGEDAVTETADILGGLVDRMRDDSYTSRDEWSLRDINGNTVGQARFVP